MSRGDVGAKTRGVKSPSLGIHHPAAQSCHESIDLAMCYIFAVCFIGVCSALQGPPDALQLAAYICVTCDPVKLIPGGPGPLNQNLPWVRAGWRDTAFHFQDWQSLGKSKFFGLKSQLHPC